MIYINIFVIAMREIPCKLFICLLGCNESRAGASRHRRRLRLEGQEPTPILARPTVRAILNGACSEAIGGWARPSLYVMDAWRGISRDERPTKVPDRCPDWPRRTDGSGK